MALSTLGLVTETTRALSSLRERRPRVHSITNSVAMHFTANVLLAVGAIPSMTIAVEEIADFVGKADALLVNLGTFDPGRRKASLFAVAVAVEERKPWVLDPVFIDRSRERAAFADELARREPRAIRGNASELRALIGSEPDDEAVRRLALDRLTVVALTGPTDLVTDGARLVRLTNGHPFMSQVTAIGDALSALIAAFLTVIDDAFVATSAAVLAMGVAGESAAEKALGPGTFGPALIDALYALDGATLDARARMLR